MHLTVPILKSKKPHRYIGLPPTPDMLKYTTNYFVIDGHFRVNQKGRSILLHTENIVPLIAYQMSDEGLFKYFQNPDGKSSKQTKRRAKNTRITSYENK